MKKALMLASVASMIEQFNMDNIRILKMLGYEVHVACNFEEGNTISNYKIEQLKIKLKIENVLFYHIPIPRKISSIKQIYCAYLIIKKLVFNNHFQIVHCHGPICGVIARMACKKARIDGTKVIYTAHGFHFYKGAPCENWLLFYPVERCLAKFTDILITVNKEDYVRAKHFSLLDNSNLFHISGVGVDVEKIQQINNDSINIKKSLGIQNNSKVLVSVGEINSNKNHELVIRALAGMQNKEIYYVICGKGKLEGYLRKLCISMGVHENVIFVGYREDVLQIIKEANIFVFPSKREGLSLAMMEAMAIGIPIICSNIRGNNELIKNGKGGFLFKSNDIESLKSKIDALIVDEDLCKKMVKFNKEKIGNYDINKISNIMKKIYIKAGGCQ